MAVYKAAVIHFLEARPPVDQEGVEVPTGTERWLLFL